MMETKSIGLLIKLTVVMVLLLLPSLLQANCPNTNGYLTQDWSQSSSAY
jgi:hypothetical protein